MMITIHIYFYTLTRQQTAIPELINFTVNSP